MYYMHWIENFNSIPYQEGDELRAISHVEKFDVQFKPGLEGYLSGGADSLPSQTIRQPSCTRPYVWLCVMWVIWVIFCHFSIARQSKQNLLDAYFNSWRYLEPGFKLFSNPTGRHTLENFLRPKIIYRCKIFATSIVLFSEHSTRTISFAKNVYINV